MSIEFQLLISQDQFNTEVFDMKINFPTSNCLLLNLFQFKILLYEKNTSKTSSSPKKL